MTIWSGFCKHLFIEMCWYGCILLPAKIVLWNVKASIIPILHLCVRYKRTNNFQWQEEVLYLILSHHSLKLEKGWRERERKESVIIQRTTVIIAQACTKTLTIYFYRCCRGLKAHYTSVFFRGWSETLRSIPFVFSVLGVYEYFRLLASVLRVKWDIWGPFHMILVLWELLWSV